MSAYYNENDPYCAQWLRNLIAANLIAPGDVDDRSIADVRPADVAGYRQCHWFAGIGGWSLAARLAGWPDDRELWTGSCPCQPFSAAGKRKGAADARHLWPEFARLIGECKPKVVFGEQVASHDGRLWLGGKQGLQRLQDREAIVRILQERNLIGGLSDTMQNMRLAGRIQAEEKNTEGSSQREQQRVAQAESRRGFGAGGRIQGVEEGSAVHPECDGNTINHRRRGVPNDRHSVQFGRRSHLGQPVAGQDRQHEGLHAGERASSALLHQCDGEYVGTKQDRRNIASDHGCTSPIIGKTTVRFGRRPEAASEFEELAGVRADLEALGYAVGAGDLCAAGVGAPHIRQRLYWVAESDEGKRGRIANTEEREFNRPTRGWQQGDGIAEHGSSTRRLADAMRAGLSREPFGLLGAGHQGNWSVFQVIECADGKTRRVEPSIFPLAHAGEWGIGSRVGLLRGSGNAIVPTLAAEFLNAYMDCRP